MCSSLEDPAGNALVEDFAVTFRQESLNRFANGQLDCDLEEWTTVSTLGEEIVYSSEDVDGAEISGSARVTQMSSSSDFSLSQCVPVQPLRRYRLGVSVRVDESAEDLKLESLCVVSPQAHCADPNLPLEAAFDRLPSTGGAWLDFEHEVAIPEEGASALCTVNVNTEALGGFDLYLDDVRLEFVELLGLPIFEDGFESGDTSAWSVTVP